MIIDNLRNYQLQGVEFLCRSESALLADEMGLGKTVQTIMAISNLHKKGVLRRSIIIAPSSLLLNWESEINKWAPDIGYRRLQGTSIDRKYTYLLPVPIIICSYEQIRMDYLVMPCDMKFDLVVLDEAQRIKNRDSKTSLACRLINRKRSWAITGTPIENTVDDLVSIFLFVKQDVISLGMPKIKIHEEIQEFFLRRKKIDVLKELPEIIIQDLLLELTDLQNNEYVDTWMLRRDILGCGKGKVTITNMLSLITKLKKICNYHSNTLSSSKIEVVKNILDESRSIDDKVIIFSQYVETLKVIASQLNEFNCEIYHGGMSLIEREKVLNKFKYNDGPKVLLISLKAGGVGLNIPEANKIVLFDRWWNPAVELQAINRAHRYGRKSCLHVIRFLVKDTIEERINSLLEQKKVIFNNYINGAKSADVGYVDKENLRIILGLRADEIETTKERSHGTCN